MMNNTFTWCIVLNLLSFHCYFFLFNIKFMNFLMQFFFLSIAHILCCCFYKCQDYHYMDFRLLFLKLHFLYQIGSWVFIELCRKYNIHKKRLDPNGWVLNDPKSNFVNQQKYYALCYTCIEHSFHGVFLQPYYCYLLVFLSQHIHAMIQKLWR